MNKSKVAVVLGTVAAVGGGALAVSRKIGKRNKYACDLIRKGCRILEEDYDLDRLQENFLGLNLDIADTKGRELLSYVECIKELNGAVYFNTEQGFTYGGGINEGVMRSLKATGRIKDFGLSSEQQDYKDCMKVMCGDKTQATSVELRAYREGCEDALEALNTIKRAGIGNKEVDEVIKYFKDCTALLQILQSDLERGTVAGKTYEEYRKEAEEALNRLKESEKDGAKADSTSNSESTTD